MTEPGGMRPLTWADALKSVVGLVLVGVLIAFALPYFLDTSWAEIGRELRRVRPWTAVLMGALLVAGLLSYTWVLSGSLPGLRHREGLMANAVSSLAANVLPLGAGVGLALQVLMFRSWGFGRRAISTSLMLTGLWNVLARIALPVIGCLVLVAGPVDAPQVVVRGAWVAGAIGTGLIGLTALAISSDAVARGLVGLLRTVSGWFGRHRLADKVEPVVADQRARLAAVVRSGFWPMTLGMAGQFVLLFGLYWCAARVVRVDVTLAGLICAYTFRQLLTVVALTPGGLGITEVGTAGILVLLGATPAQASATALLYAIYAHALVVPLGVAALVAWRAGAGGSRAPR